MMRVSHKIEKEDRDIMTTALIAVAVGSLLISIGLMFLYWQYCNCRPGNMYEYSVKQSQHQDVKYKEDTLFVDTNLSNDRSYVTSLSDSIKSFFRYSFEGPGNKSLVYNNEIVARVSAGYLEKGSNEAKEVWARRYTIKQSHPTEAKNGSIKLNQSVNIPYYEYFEKIRQLEMDLGMPLIGKLEVTSETKVWSPDIQKLNERSSISYVASLDAPVFSIEQKNTPNNIETVGLKDKGDTYLGRGILAGLIIMTLIGIMSGMGVWAKKRSLSYGRLFKTSYQRELARIYRYHDSIIIKAREPIDTKGKEVVELNSFNDLLNIEEQLNLPIIASTISPSATMFTISHDEIVYAYKIGRVTVLPKGTAPKRRKK